jgi:pyruvate ferredoxin oxidoreductase alpha subunit
MVCLDGFTISHTLERVDVLPDDLAKHYAGERQYPMVLTQEGKTVPFKLDPAHPMTMGPNALQNYYFEFKRQQEDAMGHALKRIREVNSEYAKISGRSYGNGLIDTYQIDDAEIAIVVLGSTAGTLKVIVDQLREEGIKAGVLRIRSFRPFPIEDIRNALKRIKAVAVMDKSMSPGGLGAAVFSEVRNALYGSPQRPIMVNYIFGLGGRDSSPRDLRRIYEELAHIAKTGQVEKEVHYLGLRE